ncbi:MAG: glycerophosphodiester phosphodiesterase, partial [bacterium]|nr:glycerophosphodiester phosphodiesterase [bacterium]
TKERKSSLILGHRGAMGIAPENTIISFQTALDQKVDIIELDVHLSRDKKLVVIHDEKVDRTTDGTGLVRDMTSRQIKKLDAGIKFSKKFRNARVPFLEEVMELLKGNSVRLNIELKNGPVFYPGIEEKISRMIDQYNSYDRTIVSSFDHLSLKRLKELNNRIPTAILYGNNLLNFKKYVRELRVSAVHPHYFWVTPGLIRQMHGMNIAVNTWIINTEKDFIRFSRMGVDAIGTNFPGSFAHFRDKKA